MDVISTDRADRGVRSSCEAMARKLSRAYTAARSAVQVRDNFLAIASHELRTPLSALSVLMTSMIRASGRGRLMALGEKGIGDRLIKAERQLAQLNHLVDELLDVSRLTSGDQRRCGPAGRRTSTSPGARASGRGAGA